MNPFSCLSLHMGHNNLCHKKQFNNSTELLIKPGDLSQIEEVKTVLAASSTTGHKPFTLKDLCVILCLVFP